MRFLAFLLALVAASCTGSPAFAAPIWAVNVAGAEFGPNPAPRGFNFDYVYPTAADVTLVKAMGGK
ncbi:MAG: hypothetical protein EON59_12840, partial [Alphaproteobacteria bacterium]